MFRFKLIAMLFWLVESCLPDGLLRTWQRTILEENLKENEQYDTGSKIVLQNLRRLRKKRHMMILQRVVVFCHKEKSLSIEK